MNESASIVEPMIPRKSNAKCIIFIEKDGIFARLTEDRFFVQYPSILITGKGFPDILTRYFILGMIGSCYQVVHAQITYAVSATCIRIV